MDCLNKSDGELLAEFASSKSDEAFAELFARHGAMVFHVCRRIAGRRHDAEDAVQAVFATLARKAALLSGSQTVAGWLYNTAWHVAMRWRRAETVRRRYEQDAARLDDMSAAEPSTDEVTIELYRALQMLSPEYRETIVLHHLEALTLEEVARLMNCNQGTAAARLSRARSQLRERLSWRGIMLPSVGIDALLLGSVTLEQDLHEVAAAAAAAARVSHLPPGMETEKAGASAMSMSSGIATRAIAVDAPLPSTNAAVRSVASLLSSKVACVVMLVSTGSAAAGVSAVANIPAIADALSKITRSAEAPADRKTRARSNSDDESVFTMPSLASFEHANARPVPEPGMLSAFGLAALLLARRRRR